MQILRGHCRQTMGRMTVSISTIFLILSVAFLALGENRTSRNTVYKSEPYYFINITEGTIRGIRQKTKEGTVIYSFFGLPYAAKPTRFQEPKSPASWTGVRDAIREGPSCYQYVSSLKTFAGSEDCLYANVHTSTLNDIKLPVMVWVHSGSFKTGQGTSVIYKPHLFVKRGVILITFDYRLGVFGFLSSGTADAPGNAALKDITMLLRWVKRNAKLFGGDPDNVTVFGAKAGASLVDFLPLSSTTASLYKRIITLSGTSSERRAINRDPLTWTFMLGKKLGYDITDIDQLMAILKVVPAQALATAAENLDRDDTLQPYHLTFVPVAEQTISGVTPFLTEYPDVLWEAGTYIKVPQMMGFAWDDAKTSYDKLKNVDALDSLLERFLPDDLLDAVTASGRISDIVLDIRQFYFDGGTASSLTPQGFIDYISDSRTIYSMIRNIRLKLQQAGHQIYLVKYAYGEPVAKRKKRSLRYGFDRLDHNFTSAEQVVLTNFTIMMTNFAKYGDPTPTITPETPVKWTPIVDNTTMDYLYLSETPQMLQNPNTDRISFWDLLYEVYL